MRDLKSSSRFQPATCRPPFGYIHVIIDENQSLKFYQNVLHLHFEVGVHIILALLEFHPESPSFSFVTFGCAGNSNIKSLASSINSFSQRFSSLPVILNVLLSSNTFLVTYGLHDLVRAQTT